MLLILQSAHSLCAGGILFFFPFRPKSSVLGQVQETELYRNVENFEDVRNCIVTTCTHGMYFDYFHFLHSRFVEYPGL